MFIPASGVMTNPNDMADPSTAFKTNPTLPCKVELDYEGVGLMHPDDLNDCLRRLLRHVYLQYYWPLGWAVDNDFADSAVTTWTAGQVNTVATKSRRETLPLPARVVASFSLCSSSFIAGVSFESLFNLGKERPRSCAF